jgi:MoxR-like ATPase
MLVFECDVSLQVAFLDEVFKANSSILNTLLTVLNERAFDNGDKRVACPLACVVAASNELPESEELEV